MTILSILAMLLGFGFVIFWHELGHFLGCRYAGIRVEQFAVGMGHAIVSYRKGIGIRLGNTMKEFERRTNEAFLARRSGPRSDGVVGYEAAPEMSTRERYDIARELGLGETEYRLSWLPIGGYVKPTGQDDLRPSSQAAADDPGSFAAASVGHRMIMISAGVIMNVILAAILFFILFQFVGFKSMRAGVGQVQSASPAAAAGVRGGDTLLSLHGATLHDFTKILMNVALLPSDEAVDLKLRHADGVEETVKVQARSTRDNNGMLAMGVSPVTLLRGIDPKKLDPKEVAEAEGILGPDAMLVKPGERIVAVDGTAVGDEDYATFDRALQQSFGRPVTLTIAAADGTRRDASFKPGFATMFNRATLSFLGLRPRTQIAGLSEDSVAKGKLQPGDVVLSIRRQSDATLVRTPSPETFLKTVGDAGTAGDALTFEILRGTETLTVADLRPTLKLADGRRGLGVSPAPDVAHAVVAEVAAESSASKAGLPEGATIVAVNGTPVETWSDLHRAIVTAAPDAALSIQTTSPRGDETFAIAPTSAERGLASTIRYAHPLAMLDEWKTLRKTSNPLTAVGWGITETRDLILQGYLTLQRVFGGSVPASNMSGPVGIFKAGTAFAQRGPDWFIWFLAVISANLAVVNFLPIPILDGWHFLGLIKEKITGKPLSEGVQVFAQYVGLALILSLLIFVTVNDLTR